MGIKRRFKIKRQQRWKRRKERKKTSVKNPPVAKQRAAEGTADISEQTKPPASA